MTGRRIRWENAVKAGALVAAAIAVIAALPSLLGPAPPAPPPPDVGIAALPEPAPPPQPVVPPPAPAPEKAGKPALKRRNGDAGTGAAKRRTPVAPKSREKGRRRPEEATNTAAAPALIAPAPVYVAPPPSRERFGFEG